MAANLLFTHKLMAIANLFRAEFDSDLIWTRNPVNGQINWWYWDVLDDSNCNGQILIYKKEYFFLLKKGNVFLGWK